jgi:hypothetical protein
VNGLVCSLTSTPGASSLGLNVNGAMLQFLHRRDDHLVGGALRDRNYSSEMIC